MVPSSKMSGEPVDFPRVARSALFVPAVNTDRIPKAFASGADVVVVDLEDAVAADAKQAARDALAFFLAERPTGGFWVRTNAPDSEHFEKDLAFCARQALILGLMIPKTEHPDPLNHALAKSGKPVWPLIESAQGLASISTIAAVRGVERLGIGAIDLALDLDLVDGHAGAQAILDQANYALVLHSKLAGLAPPLAGICPAIRDIDLITRDAERARAMGFGGMLCIHPAQIEPVHRAFTPTSAQVEWARRVIAGSTGGPGTFQVDGEMVDAPIIERARRILARSVLPRQAAPSDQGGL